MSPLDQPIPTTMRAWTYSNRGTPREVLTLKPDQAVPSSPTGSDLLIRVAYAGMSPNGPLLMSMIPPLLSKTRIPELDFSGLIAAAGPMAPGDLIPGTRVFGTVNPFTLAILYGQGSMAEFVLVNANDVIKVPDTINLVNVAGLSDVGQTALKLVEVVALKKGARVLVNGASGGIGTILVQILKVEEMEVVATCSAANIELVRSLGADEVIDYRQHAPLHEYLASEFKGKPFEAIFDLTGSQALYKNSPSYLHLDGPCINIGNYEGMLRTFWNWLMNTIRPVFLGGIPRRYIMQSTPPHRDAGRRVVEMMAKGKIKAVIDDVFDMEDALKAYDRLISRRAKGKLIVRINNLDDM